MSLGSTSPPTRCWIRVSNAVLISRSVLAFRTWSSSPERARSDLHVNCRYYSGRSLALASLPRRETTFALIGVPSELGLLDRTVGAQ